MFTDTDSGPVIMENKSPERRFHWESAEDDFWHEVLEYAATCLTICLIAYFFLLLLETAQI